jgi:hypothetical protein
MRLDEEKIVLRDKAFHDTEATGALAQFPAKVSVATQPVPIQIKGLLKAAGQQSLFNQKLVLIQDCRLARRCRRFRLQAGSQFGAHHSWMDSGLVLKRFRKSPRRKG